MTTGIRVLLIDDDEDDQLLFCEVIQTIYPDGLCKVAATADEALNTLSSSPPFDIIFLDLYLPKINGFELLPHINELNGKDTVPTYVITSFVTGKEAKTLKQLGVVDILIKPSTFSELTSNVRKVLQESVKPIKVSNNA